MKKLIVCIMCLLMFIPSVTFATNNAELTTNFASLAESVMSARQDGMPKVLIQKIITKQELDESGVAVVNIIVNTAYKIPLTEDKELITKHYKQFIRAYFENALEK